LLKAQTSWPVHASGRCHLLLHCLQALAELRLREQATQPVLLHVLDSMWGLHRQPRPPCACMGCRLRERLPSTSCDWVLRHSRPAKTALLLLLGGLTVAIAVLQAVPASCLALHKFVQLLGDGLLGDGAHLHAAKLRCSSALHACGACICE
jgi:hypothetical protein